MTLLGVLLAASTLGYTLVFWLVLRHLKDRDRHERDERAREARERDAGQNRHAAQLEALVARHLEQVDQLVAQIRAAHDARSEEIQTLLQRIQAPEIAIMQHQVETAGPGEAILPLSDEQAAEREQELRVAIEQIERIENQGVWS
jgi:hypothetical protein